MSDKLLLVSMVDLNPKTVDVEEVKREWEEYKVHGILREYSSAVFLYLSAKSYTLMGRLLSFERRRLLNKVNRDTYYELFSGVSSKDIPYHLLKELVSRFNLSNHIRLSKRVVNSSIPVVEVVMDVETAILIDLPSMIKNSDSILNINNGIVTLLSYNTQLVLNMMISIYMDMLQQLILQHKNMIIQKYHSDVFEEIAKSEHAYEYKIEKFPPCIERVLNGDVSEGQRNNVMFALINFLKASALMFNSGFSVDEIKDMVWEANNNMPSPLPESEVRNLIRYHIDNNFFKVYGWCNKMRDAGLCAEKSFSVCLKKYFKRNSHR